MKNGNFNPLLIITVVFCVFLLGLLSGRLLPLRTHSLHSSAVRVSDLAAVESTAAEATAVGLININTASAEDLRLLPGIGPSLAERIIAYRQTVGSFQTVDELLNVKGIGDSIFSKISKYITAGG